MENLREEFFETPTEVPHAELDKYKDGNTTRLPVTEIDRRHPTTVGSPDDQITNIRTSTRSSGKRKKKCSSSGILKGMDLKKRRFH